VLRADEERVVRQVRVDLAARLEGCELRPGHGRRELDQYAVVTERRGRRRADLANVDDLRCEGDGVTAVRIRPLRVASRRTGGEDAEQEPRELAMACHELPPFGGQTSTRL